MRSKAARLPLVLLCRPLTCRNRGNQQPCLPDALCTASTEAGNSLSGLPFCTARKALEVSSDPSFDRQAEQGKYHTKVHAHDHGGRSIACHHAYDSLFPEDFD